MFGQTCEVLRQKVKNVNYEHLIAQGRGISVSLAGIRASECDINKALREVREEVDYFMSLDEFRS